MARNSSSSSVTSKSDSSLRRRSRSWTTSRARAESLLALAAVAEADSDYDAAQYVYERMLDEQTADPLQMHTTRVALAATIGKGLSEGPGDIGGQDS